MNLSTTTMAYQYRISREHDLTLVEASGSVAGPDIVASIKDLFADPRWYYGMRQINDFRHITRFVVELADLDAISRLEQAAAEAAPAAGQSSTPRLAIVVAEAMYEPICKLYAVRDKTRPLDVLVTRSMEEAARWVGLDADVQHLFAQRRAIG